MSSDESSAIPSPLSSSPVSSPLPPLREPLTSPLTAAGESPQPSSTPSELPSSPYRRVNTSPLRSSPVSSPYFGSSSSSSSDNIPVKKRKRYELSQLEGPVDPLYWPPPAAVSSEDPNNHSSHVHEAEPNEPLSHQQDPTSSVASPGTADFNDSVISSDCSSVSGDSSCLGDSSVLSDSDQSFISDDSSKSSLSDSDADKSEDDCDNLHFGSFKIYEGCRLTVDEGVITLMDLFMTHKLEKKTVESILKAFLKFLPESNGMPQSKYKLFKYVEDVCSPIPINVHYYCKACLYYVGCEEEMCPLCGSSCNKYYQLPLADQIKNLFENHSMAEIINSYAEERKGRQSDKLFFDVCDGSEFNRVQLPGNYNLTLLGHTDGVSISKSSKVSLWPLEFVITQLPPKLRFKFVLIAGVWVDHCKPNLNCYLKLTVDELQRLFNTGVVWINPATKNEEKSLVVAPFFCADAPVRAQIQNILSHGGKHCCHSCEQKMKKLPKEPILLGVKEKKRKRVFIPQENQSKLRTAECMEAQNRKTQENRRHTGKFVAVKGVKGTSIISKIPLCDPSTAVYPEYMHSILGITKQFMYLWFETDLECNLKAHRDQINALLENIRVPDFVSRIPRSTECYGSWKANECRSFVIYFSLIILAKFMSRKYLQHWMLFIYALYLFLQDVVSEPDIQKAEIMLKMFLRDFSKLYTAEQLSYNLHNLSHYGLSTRRWGPPWCISAFPFESFNGLLQQRIHGSKNQGIELIQTVRLYQGLQILKARSEKLSNKKKPTVEFRNKAHSYQFNKVQKNVLAASNLELNDVFYRAVISGEVFTCNSYERQQKRNNFTICFLDLSNIKGYGENKCFIEFSGGKKMAFVNCFVIEHLRMFHLESGTVVKHIIPIKEGDELLLIPLENILYKVIRVDSFVCIQANKCEVNL